LLSGSQIKFIRSLRQKKYRELHRCFIAEGSKLAVELTASRFQVRHIYALRSWVDQIPWSLEIPLTEVTPVEMGRITTLASPGPVLAVVNMDEPVIDLHQLKSSLTLMFDDIQDPGNLGTMIRVADWFGIGEVVCSPATVDLYNPKVVQASMGSLSRVRIHYRNLRLLLEELQGCIPVYGMMLKGEDIYEAEIEQRGIILIGNEAHGISNELNRYITRRLSIPFYPGSRKDHAESLNAAVATGIVCAEFRRRRE